MNYKKQKNIHKGGNQRGFTIVETLVAITILVVAVLGPMVIISQALKISFFSRDQMTSFYLAQEPIEYIRNLRDKNALTKLDPNEWLDDIASDGPLIVAEITAPNSSLTKYYLEHDINGNYDLRQCPVAGCPKMKLNMVSGLYGEDSDSPSADSKDSIYTREITFSETPGDEQDLVENQEILINVTMKWNQVGGEYSYQLHEFLNNWKIQNYEEN